MSVALLIKKSPSTVQELLPIATEAVYQSQWLRFASAHGLRWLQLFQAGVEIPLPSLPEVASEFEVIKDSFIVAGLSELAARAEAASAALREVAGKYPEAEVFIG